MGQFVFQAVGVLLELGQGDFVVPVVMGEGGQLALEVSDGLAPVQFEEGVEFLF